MLRIKICLMPLVQDAQDSFRPRHRFLSVVSIVTEGIESYLPMWVALIKCSMEMGGFRSENTLEYPKEIIHALRHGLSLQTIIPYVGAYSSYVAAGVDIPSSRLFASQQWRGKGTESLIA